MPGYVKRAATSDPTYKPPKGARRKRRAKVTGAAVPKPITVHEVYLWGRLFFAEKDMAQIAKVSRSTIQAIKRDETYRRAYDQGVAEAKMALKRAQYAKAMAGDTKMLIFLGKVVLGQRERPASKNHENAQKQQRERAMRQLQAMDPAKLQQLRILLLADDCVTGR